MQERNVYQRGRAFRPCADAADRSGPSVAPWRIVELATVLALLPVAAWAHEIGDEANEALARGLNMSILFLLCMPVTIVGVIFVTVYLTQKRAQRQVHQDNETHSR